MHAKFQPSSFKAVGGDSWNRGTKFYFSTIPYRISKHPPFALVAQRDNQATST